MIRLIAVVMIIRMMTTTSCVQAALMVIAASNVMLDADTVQATGYVTRRREVVQTDVRPVISHHFARPVSVV